MKKPVKIALIVIAVIVVVALLAICAVLIFAKDKTVLTAEEFKTQMEEKGYIVEDATYQSTSDDHIDQIYEATSQDNGYKIEFYVFENIEYAKMFYDVNKDAFEDTISSGYLKSSISIKNYSKYSLSSNNKYKVLSRVENTVIYVNENIAYTDAIKNLLNEIGY